MPLTDLNTFGKGWGMTAISSVIIGGASLNRTNPKEKLRRIRR
jgi:hypothetical protein